MQHVRRGGIAALVAGLLLAALTSLVPTAATAATTPDPFFTYTGARPLADYAPGAVLKTRTVRYSLAGLATPVQVVQVVFRSTDGRGRPSAAVTSVFRPLLGSASKVLSYQSFYDSLNPEDGPSRAIAGGTSAGGFATHAETAMVVQFLLRGYAIVMADTEGPTADFANGPEYGKVTLDALRAAFRTTSTGIAPGARAAMIGYSGGAIATQWAAVLAPSYAPDVNKRLVGAATGGILVRPHENLRYIDGQGQWAGVIPLALIGAARGFGIDLQPYLSEYGKQVYADLEDAAILQAIGGQYSGLTFRSLVKPAYADPASIPVFVTAVNKLNLGTRANPTIPLFMGQGTAGELEGSSGSTPGVGRGDGVMVAGDVRTLARKYCAGGVKVVHREYGLSHFSSVPLWLPEASSWIVSRFGTSSAPSNCATIPAGNPLTPLKAS